MKHSDLINPSRRQFLFAAGTAIVIPLAIIPTHVQASENTALINKIRAANNLPLLQSEQKLQQAALSQAQLMARHSKMGHSIGWGNGFAARLKKAGIRGVAAENVAVGQKTVAAVLSAWMNSAGHRKNLLDPSFTRYGLAYASPATKPDYRYWALILGR